MNDTTRRYPRSLDEAFPGHDTRYACAIERPGFAMRRWERLLAWASVIGLVLLVAWTAVQWAAA